MRVEGGWEAGGQGKRALLVLVKAAHESAKVKCIHDNAYTSRCAGNLMQSGRAKQRCSLSCVTASWN